MISHTLILSTPKREIPNEEIIQFLQELIANNLTNIDYFGEELDNQDDFRDEKMQLKYDSSTIITFHFENDAINYNTLSEAETFKIINLFMDSNRKTNIIVDNKDIDIYFV
jgi:hypothetical protein